jgi:hypothetical protein
LKVPDGVPLKVVADGKVYVSEFRRPDRLFRQSPAQCPPSFNFNKNQKFPAAGNNVNFSAADAKIAGDYFVTFGLQVSGR